MGRDWRRGVREGLATALGRGWRRRCGVWEGLAAAVGTGSRAAVGDLDYHSQRYASFIEYGLRRRVVLDHDRIGKVRECLGNRAGKGSP